MPDLRCNGCRQKVGTTTRTQPVPVQCTDPFCPLTPPPTQNEVRDSFIDYLANVSLRTPEHIGEVVGLTRQGVMRVLSSR